MDALRRLSWPNLIPINRRQTSQPLPSTPNSPIPISFSVQDLVVQIESRQECPHRRLSEEPRGHSPTGHSVIPRPAANHSRTFGPFVAAKQADQILSSKMAKMEGCTSGSYVQPSSPEVSGDIGQELIEHLLQASRLPSAVDFTADDSGDLPPIPDTPTDYARFGLISRESFNTAVRDLIQESPDTPIGCDGAAPIKISSSIGTLAINGSRIYLDAPKIKTSSPPQTLEVEDGKKKALRSRSNFSEPFQELCELKMSLHTSASSPRMMMMTPQSARVDGSHNQISISLDGPGGGSADVRDFAAQPEFPPLPDCCVSPRSLVSDGYIFASPPIDPEVAKENLFGFPVSVDNPAQIMIDEVSTDQQTALDAAVISGVTATNSTGAPSAPGVTVIVAEEVRVRELKAPGHVPVAEEVKIKRPNAPILQIPAVGIPTDTTGQLTPPGTPPRRGKGGKAIRTGQKALRKGRRIMLTRPVLTLLVGRQLSRPTSQALKLISKGVPVSLSDLPCSAAPTPTPRIPA